MGRRKRRRQTNAKPATNAKNDSPTVVGPVPNNPATQIDAAPLRPAAAPNDFAPLSQEDYIRERTHLIEAEQKGAEEHDKAILTLAAGALALSLAFLEKVAPSPKPDTYIWVGVAWGAFVLCIILVLASLLASQRACQEARELLDRMFAQQRKQTPRNLFSHSTRWFNRISYFCFVAGVSSLAAFGWLNLPKGNNSMGQQSQQPANPPDPKTTPGHGVVPPKPPVTRPIPPNPKK